MSFETECCEMRKNKGARLTTLIKLSKKYSPLIDEQVLLAGVILVLRRNNLKICKNQIYYAFKKNYNKEFHGDVQSYTTWLYSLLQPSNKKPYNSISGKSKAYFTHNLNERSKGTLKPLLIVKPVRKTIYSSLGQCFGGLEDE